MAVAPLAHIDVEHNFTEPVVSWIKDWEDSGGLYKIIAYAAAFFLMIPCFVSIVGIPIFVWGSTEYGRQDAVRNVRRLPLPGGAGVGAAAPDDDLQQQIDDLTEQNRNLQLERNTARDQRNDFDTRLARLQQTYQEEHARLVHLESEQPEMARLRAELKRAAEENTALQAQVGDAGKASTQWQGRFTDLQAGYDKLRRASALKDEQLAGAAQAHEAQNLVLGHVQEENAAHAATIARLTRENESLTRSNTELGKGNAALGGLQAQLAETREQLGKITQEKTQAEETLQRRATELEAARAQLQTAQGKAHENGQTIAQLQEQVRDMEGKLTAAKQAMDEMTARATTAETNAAKLRQQLATAESTHQAANAKFAQEKAGLEGRLTETQQAVETATTRATTAEASVTTLRQQLLAAQKAQQAANTKFAEEKAGLEGRLTETQQALETATTRATTAETNVATLQRQLDAAKKAQTTASTKFDQEKAALREQLQAAQTAARDAEGLRADLEQLRKAASGKVKTQQEFDQLRSELSAERLAHANDIHSKDQQIRNLRQVATNTYNAKMAFCSKLTATQVNELRSLGTWAANWVPLDLDAEINKQGSGDRISIVSGAPSQPAAAKTPATDAPQITLGPPSSFSANGGQSAQPSEASNRAAPAKSAAKKTAAKKAA